MKTLRIATGWAAFCALGLMANAADAPAPLPAPLPDTGAALLRVFGALLLVFALLFVGV